MIACRQLCRHTERIVMTRGSQRMKPGTAWFAVLGGWLLTSAAAAHDLGAEVRLAGQYLEVHAFFDDGSMARNARVELLRCADQQLVAAGRTDQHGRCRLSRPPAGRYRVRINAGAGHIHEETVTVPPAPDSSTISEPPELASPAASQEAESIRISSGPTYEEKPRFRWLKLSLGLIAIFALALASWWLLRIRQTPLADGQNNTAAVQRDAAKL